MHKEKAESLEWDNIRMWRDIKQKAEDHVNKTQMCLQSWMLLRPRMEQT